MAKPQQFTECQNDHTELVGAYCHTCGQRADEPRRVVIGLVQDFLVDTLAIDGKLARSIWLLLSRPGRLARRYLDGRRVHYSPPFRLYLFTSVFFFLAFFWTTDFGRINPSKLGPDAFVVSDEALRELEAEDPEAAAKLRALLESQKAKNAADVDEQEGADENVKTGVAKEDQESASEKADKDNFSLSKSSWEDANYKGPTWLEPYVKQMFEAAQRALKDPRLFFAQMRETLPRTLLLAPVLYALILLGLYFYRRKFYIYDHLVVSLYMHAALYAYLLLAILIGQIPLIGGLAFVPLAWGWLQPFVVFRQAYGSGWISAFLKWAISIIIYSVGVALIISLGLSYTLYQS